MTEVVVFELRAVDSGWVVTRDNKVLVHYKSQSIGEREMARLARAVANGGGKARAIFHKRDGSVMSERSYTKRTTPWLRRKN